MPPPRLPDSAALVQHTKPYFLVGIGGSGMMPLAHILLGQGASVAGSDRSLDQARLSAKFDDLRARGVRLFPQDGSGITSPDQIVVASAAVEDSVPDIQAAAALGCQRKSRAQLLSELFNAAPLPIGVAGTSGKSTVTGMIGWILHACGRDPTVMNGAVMTNFVAEDRPYASALVGAGDAFVSEVDESDGSIAGYWPRIAVLNNISLDHKSMDELRTLFAAFIAKAAIAVINTGDPEGAALAMQLPKDRRVTFAVESEADLSAHDVREQPAGATFTLHAGEDRLTVTLAVPGRHNIANALAALAAARAGGVPLSQAAEAIAGFNGLRRRLEVVGETAGVTVIDDFAHNPDKITATLQTLHAFPGRLLILVQPHGFGPLRVMRTELVAAFARHLRPDDVLILPDPVYFGGTTDRSVGSDAIVADLAVTGATARHIPDRASAAAAIVTEARAGDRIVVMGARDDTLSLLAREMLDQVAGRLA